MIVRARDKRDTIERTLLALRRQTVQPEIVVVDSGSRDATTRIAARYCDILVELAPERFSYGRALNLGAAHASGHVHFALSAHCAPGRTDWIERSLAHYAAPEVAATGGARQFPDGARLSEPFLQDLAHARRHPYWGYSNHAGSWRADVWRDFPFDESLPASEDREWAFRVMEAGLRIAFDPALEVDQSHRGREPWARWYRRRRREMEALVNVNRNLSYDVRDLLREWWRGDPLERERALMRLRVSPHRVVGLAGKYAGARTRRP